MLPTVRLLMAPVAVTSLAIALVPLAAIVCLGSQALVPLLRDPSWVEAAQHSVRLAAGTAIVAWPAGMLAALAIWGAAAPLRRFVLTAGLASLLTPPGWIAAGILAIAERSGLPQQHLLVQVLAHAAPASGLVLLILTGVLNRLDPRLMQAAAACGAPPAPAFALILLPNLSVGLWLAAAAAFALTLCGGAFDRVLAAPDHPSLAGLLGAASQAGDLSAAPAALLLALIAACPLALFALWLLLRRRWA